jgi:hypothetical protein
MWKNLQRLSQVVAPPLEDDDDDEYYEEEEEDIDSQDDDVIYEYAEEENETPSKSRFGLVGILARALDNKREYEVEESAEEEMIDLDYPNNETGDAHVGFSEDAALFPTPENVTESVGVDYLASPSRNDNSAESPIHLPPLRRESGTISPRSQVNLSRLFDVSDNAVLTPYLDAKDQDVDVANEMSSKDEMPAIDVSFHDEVYSNNAGSINHKIDEQRIEVVHDNTESSEHANDAEFLLNPEGLSNPLLLQSSSAPSNGLASLTRPSRSSIVEEKKEATFIHSSSSVSSSSWQPTPVMDDSSRKSSPVPNFGHETNTHDPPEQSSATAVLNEIVYKQFADSILGQDYDEADDNSHNRAQHHRNTSLDEVEVKVNSSVTGSTDNNERDTILLHRAESNHQENIIVEYEAKCRLLSQQLEQAEHHILELQQQARDRMDVEEKSQVKQTQLLEKSMMDWSREKQHLLRQIEDANDKAYQFQVELQQVLQHENTASQQLKRHERAMQMAEDKLAQTMAMVDEREEQIIALQTTVESLQSSMKEHHHGAREAEEELDELHGENEMLHQRVESLETENKKLKTEMTKLQRDSDKLSNLKVRIQIDILLNSLVLLTMR